MKNNNDWRVERAKKVLTLLHTGVETSDGEVRDFNILDYYRITNITPKTLYEISADYLKKNYSDMEIKKFRSFVLKSLNDTKITIKAIMDVKHSVMVNDEPRVIEDCEKTAVIQFLKTNKIPLTSNTYALTLKKYLSGELDFTDVMEEKNEMLVK